MAQTGKTPIVLYHSTVASAVPSNANLQAGELAMNIADMKLYAENSGGTVTLLASADAAAGNFTTVDTTNLEVTNIKAKDGTAAIVITDSTGAVTVSSPFATTGNTTLGNASGDTVTVTGTITSNLIFTDNTYDIGASGATRPRNLFLAGNATIGGSIAATTLDLTNLEVTNIKAKDGTASATIADSTGVMTIGSSVLTTTDINGGTIDATAIGGTTPAAGAFTTLSATGNLTVTGSTTKLSGATQLDITQDTGRLASAGLRFRNNTLNTGSGLSVMPNGSGTAEFRWYNTDDVTGTNLGAVRAYMSSTTTFALGALSWGAGTLPTTLALGLNTSITGGLTVSGDTTLQGNTVLGDASTDTVTVNGYMGVGGAASVAAGIRITSSGLLGGVQYGILSQVVGTSAISAGGVRAFSATAGTEAGSYTAPSATGLWVQDVVKGAGSTITSVYGIRIDDQTQGTNNYGIVSLVSSGANKWNIYASGTADNVLRGNVRIGSTVAPTVALDVTGAISASSTITAGIDGSSVAYYLPGNGAIRSVGGGIMYIDSAPTVGGDIQIRPASIPVGVFSSTGLAVTGAISASTSLTVTGGTITTGSTTALSLATSGGTQAVFLNAASAVNYLAISGAGAGADVYLQPQGSDTNIGLFVGSKGTDGVFLHTGGSSYTTQVAITHTASANRYITLTGSNGGNPRIDTNAGSLVLGSGGLTNAIAITGSGAGAPILSPVGAANLGIAFYSAGTGALDFGTAGGTLQVKVAHTASAVNYVSLTGGSTANPVFFTAAGSDTNIGTAFSTKGTGAHSFYTNGLAGTLQAQILHTASAVNYMTLTGSTTGNPLVISAEGSDTDIAATLVSKGAGNVRLSTGSASNIQVLVSATASANRYITLTGSNGGNPTIGTSAGSLLLAPAGATGLRVSAVASQANYLVMSGTAATGSIAELYAEGSDSTITINYASKGAGSHNFYSDIGTAALQFAVIRTASANRYISVTGSNGGNPTIGTSAGNLAVSAGLEISKTAVTSPATTDGNVFSGIYTPTLTNVTNVAASTAYNSGYMRVGNIVTVAGRVDIDPTVVGSITLDMTLPVASALTSSQQLGGTFSGSDSAGGSIYAEATGDTARFIGTLTDAGNRDYYFSFTYRVI